MIGYKCSPSSAQVSGAMRAPSPPNEYRPETGAANTANPASDERSASNHNSNNTNANEHNEQQPQVGIKREPSGCQTVLSSLSSHINLINQHGKQSALVHTSSTGGPSAAGQPNGGQQSPSQLIQGLHSAASPGYHSAASSPGSSAASPVSSSSSAAGSSSCSASSGISTVHSSSSVSPSSSRSPISPNLLDHYPELNQDGLGLSWFHDANSRARLSAALMSKYNRSITSERRLVREAPRLTSQPLSLNALPQPTKCSFRATSRWRK